jgi:NADH-quinone oxidoreductase subunit L
MFLFDRLSIPFAILSFVLAGTIGAFASKYMHRERGFNRFFVLYSVFVLGMEVTAPAGTIETLFVGWELVGLSPAFLVAFYQERPAPARNGLWVWIIYQVSDASLLLASVVMHHLRGERDFDKLLGPGPWPEAVSTRSSLASERSKSFHEPSASALARPGDRDHIARFAVCQPGAEP